MHHADWWEISGSCIVAGILVVHCGLPVASADMISLVPTQDNSLYEISDGSLSNGSGDYLFTGHTGQAVGRRGRRALLMFDITGNIPAGATIDAATLTLHLSQTVGGVTDVNLHRVTNSWGEGGSDAEAEEGKGAPSASGDATWLHRDYNSTLWASPGGDFDPASSAVTPVAFFGPFSWSSQDMVDDVQQWLDAPTDNFGWILIGDESTTFTAKRFASREHPTAADRPVLDIQFTVPEPTTLLLAGLGGLLVFSRATRISP